MNCYYYKMWLTRIGKTTTIIGPLNFPSAFHLTQSNAKHRVGASGQYKKYWKIFNRFWAQVRLRGWRLGGVESCPSLKLVHGDEDRLLLFYFVAVPDAMCRVILLGGDVIMSKPYYCTSFIRCMTMLSTEIWIMWWNDHLGLSHYTSYLWISLHGN
jgi:hypothetical protein